MAYSDCQDYRAFQRAGLADVYEEIGNYNLFMACEMLNTSALRTLAEGYSFRLCRRDELEAWKHIHVDDHYIAYISNFYNQVYAPHEEEFFRRCTFVVDSDDKPIASCFLWRSYGQINTVGWFRVLPEHEGRGIGRALLSEILRTAQFPVYLHTQPTSLCAIKLYSDFGFQLITNSAVGYRQNDLIESLPYMQKAMTEADYARLRFIQADDSLHQAALSTKVSEF